MIKEEGVEGKKKREICEKGSQVDTKVENKERIGKFEYKEERKRGKEIIG